MSDPIRDLENFSTTPTARLDAVEVRRRGDQRRRRRQVGGTVAVAAAVAVIASTGAVLATGGDNDAVAPPATTTTDQLSTIPDDFPLDIGLTSAKVTDSAAMADLDYCGTEPLRDLEPSDVRTAAIHDSTVASTRTLFLLDDAEAAEAARAAIVAAASDCTGGDPRDVGKVTVLPTSEGWAGSTVAEEFPAREGTTASTEVIHAITSGNALLVVSDWFSAASDPSPDADSGGELDPLLPSAEELAMATQEALAPLINEMSLFVTLRKPEEPENPLLMSQAPESELVDRGGVPDLELTRGFVDMSGDGGKQLGPSPKLTGIDRTLVCGQPLVPQRPLPTGRLLASNSGPEFLEVRQVLAYPDADAAKQAFDTLFQTVSACTPQKAAAGGSVVASRVWQVFGSGNPDSVVFADTAAEGLGGQLYRVSRFGRALLVMMQSGEWSTDTVGGGLIGLDRSGEIVAPMLCSFTEQGC